MGLVARVKGGGGGEMPRRKSKTVFNNNYIIIYQDPLWIPYSITGQIIYFRLGISN